MNLRVTNQSHHNLYWALWFYNRIHIRYVSCFKTFSPLSVPNFRVGLDLIIKFSMKPRTMDGVIVAVQSARKSDYLMLQMQGKFDWLFVLTNLT